jgi:hypothetical protein
VLNKHVRYRACQLVAEILESLTEEMSEELWDELKVALLKRLRDKIVPVRMQAARALSRLQVCFYISLGCARWVTLRGGCRSSQVVSEWTWWTHK